MPMLSASAMPRVAADTLVGDTDHSVILVYGGHWHGHGHHWGRGRHRGWR
jgi:hypothetical protein